MSDSRLNQIRDLIQDDVGNRGLGKDPSANLLNAFPDDFARACRSLAEPGQASVAVVTGFFIPTADPPAGETDGPLGAVFLARALVPLGIKVVLASDGFCIRALETGLAACGLRKSVPLITLPSPAEAGTMSGADYRQWFAERAGPLTHLIALERVGLSHTPETLQAQGAASDAIARFRKEVPAEHWDRCHTMRGRDITMTMSPAQRLFEAPAAESAPSPLPLSPAAGERGRGEGVTTIGIGDGGNEIGMGKIPWDIIRRNIPGGAVVACRVATDLLIVCGISNWGAYGLAAGVRLLRGKSEKELFDSEKEREILERMVDNGPLVDGVTSQPTATVDGIAFDRYAEPLRQLAEL
jgi:hypothetical protein